MRTGKNPAKTGIPAYAPRQLGVALLVYIPSQEGYFQQSLEILRYQIDSLYRSTSQEFDLLVFNNGSCPNVVKTLQEWYEEKRITWLVHSQHNLGKAGAWNWILGSVPNEIICYADSDVLFRPGWLEASLRILEAFPQAGMVSAQPNFFDVLDGEGTAHLPLLNDPDYEFGEYLPPAEIIDEYCFGIGADEEQSAAFHRNPIPYIVNRKNNVRAVMGASHMQFITRREIARQVIPLPATRAIYRPETISLDRHMDQAGYLHLSTQENYVFHMGNTITDYLLNELKTLQVSHQPLPRPQNRAVEKRSLHYRAAAALARRPQMHNLFKRLYNFLFRVLYTEG